MFRAIALSVALLLPLPVMASTPRDLAKARPPRPAPHSVWPPPLEGITVHRDIEYAKPGGKPLLLDLYIPQDEPGLLPLVLWVHGGGWRMGDKSNSPAVVLCHRGYAVASIRYRFSQEAVFPAQIQDCKAAVRFLRTEARKYRLDPNRFGAWGASAGGHLVALLGTAGDEPQLESDVEEEPAVSSRVQAVCNWFGPVDFLTMGGWHEEDDSFESQLIGGPVRRHQEKARRANPARYASKDDPPFLIMHGQEDKVVPARQSELLYEALRQAGVEAACHILPKQGHGFEGFGPLRMAEEFFDRHLKKPAPTTAPTKS